ncbi:unnamed protein product [Discula destructiva]
MADPQTNLDYFTCTLGEAARWNQEHPHPFKTVSHLIDEQAEELRQRPAVTFPGGCPGENGRAMKSDFTYRELRTYSIAASARLRRRLQVSTRVGSGTAGLLCSSTPEFILAWLGLIRLGMSVMLLAPQLDSKAIKHLCDTCKISTVFADARNYDTAKNLKDGILAINISNLLFSLKVDSAATIPITSTASDIAYLFHTSGTSSGLPKPIPQTHHAAVGVLPRLPGGEMHATFSTTPLYHGGIADCFRAWTSGATIHLFPGTQPITFNNIRRAVDRANAFLRGAYPVRYFTSVPYILQMLLHEPSSAEQASGLKLLQVMELVGVGGAALPPSVGNELVANEVNVVSRFGSAECGFLLSSKRAYATDREWAYLRADPSLQPDYYDFEPQAQGEGDDGPPLFEFIVKSKWPHRGKINRPDGSFATADLFEKHPIIPNAWRYHSRADAQITLVNGKKFDPAPVESELLTSKLGKQTLRDAMIFGTGRDAPGLLLLPRRDASFVSDEQVIEEIWPTIERMNGETQSHARIGRNSIVVVHGQDHQPATLPKSSKGTILRLQAEEMYAAHIERVYGETEDESHQKKDVPDSQVMEELTRLFNDVLGRPVSPSGDLFAQGVDSVACAQLRKRISSQFCSNFDNALPLNIIYDQGSIERLSSYILRCRVAGDMVVPGGAGNEEEQSEEQLMLDLVEKHKRAIYSPMGSFDHSKERVVVLTGATGFLGAHVLDLLLRDPMVSKVFCLVRAEDADDAAERVKESLHSRNLRDADHREALGSRLVCLSCSLSESRLGLSQAEWNQVSEQSTMIIHAAWSVNFSLKLKSFEGQLAGLRNLLELRNATRGSAARFVLISSTAAVSAMSLGDRPIPESSSSEPEDASPLGYSRSKWVAENICTSARVGGSSPVPAASAEPTLAAEEKSPIIIVRVGQLCGNKQTGAWNTTEAYPIMLSSAKITGCLPDLADEALSWLPVDMAAQALLDLSFYMPGGADPHTNDNNATATTSVVRGLKSQKTPVYHVVNAHQDPIWSDMADWLVDFAPSPSRGRKQFIADHNGEGHDRAAPQQQELRIVSPSEWLQALEKALESHDHPARNLLHLWKESLGGDQHEDHPSPLFDTRRAEAASETMKAVQPLGKADVVRMWDWIQVNV